MQKWAMMFLGMLVLSGCASISSSQPDSLLTKLQGGSYVIFFRHAATDHSQQDTDLKDPKNCKAQRHLDDKGREQARVIGEGFKASNIPVGDVFSSHFCRCTNTAKIAFGKVEAISDITSIQGVTPEERSRRIAGIRALLNTPPKPGTNTVLIAHKWMFKEASGQLLEEGEAAIFKPQSDPTAQFIRRVKPDEWENIGRLD